MTWKAGINSVLNTFALLCVLSALSAVPLPAMGAAVEMSVFQLVMAIAGLTFTIGAWKRDFWGFVGVLAICAIAALYDVVLLTVLGSADPIRVLNAVLYGTVGAALYTLRRQFPRQSRTPG